MKDWAEILHTQKRFEQAEKKIRMALELLEYKDSDALFTLGVILSEQGRDDESIEAYKQSVQLNAEDAELWYENLCLKLSYVGTSDLTNPHLFLQLQLGPKAWCQRFGEGGMFRSCAESVLVLDVCSYQQL